MKEKLMSMLRALKSKLVVLKDKVFGVKKHLTLKTLSWVVPAVIIVVGLVVLFAVPAGDSQKAADEEDALAAVENVDLPAVVGMYESGLLPAASTPGREFTLALAEDGSASLVADYKTGDRLVDEIGTWTRADDRLTVTITKRFGHDVEPAVYAFTIAGDALSLVDYEFSRWGSMGLTLTRKK
jgi:hypothetical protein